MKKVTIEITPKGWTTTVQLDQATYTESHVATPTGAHGNGGNLDEIDDDELLQSLTGFAQYEIMNALQNLL